MAQSEFETVDEANDEITLDVLERVAAANDTSVTNLAPLYFAVDPDALGALLQRSNANLRVAFEYEGRTVTIGEDGEVTVGEGL